MSLKTQLQSALAYCNTQLASKGVTDTATSVVDVGDKIETIQTGGIDENTVYVSKFTTSMSGWFQNAYPRMRNIDVILDLQYATNLTDMQNAFRLAQPHSITIIGSTANVTNFSGAFKENGTIFETIGILDFSSITSGGSSIFEYSQGLKNITLVPNTLGISMSFGSCNLLTTDSLVSIIAGLKDMTGATSPTLTLHATPKAKLTAEQIATITAKNWTLA